jgi:hypothetical protein
VVQFEKEASQTRDYCLEKTRWLEWLAQIPFDYAQGRLSLRKERLLRMTTKLHHYPQIEIRFILDFKMVV